MVELVTLQMRDCIFLSAQELGLKRKYILCIEMHITRTCVCVLNVLEIHHSNWNICASRTGKALSLQIAVQMSWDEE